MNNMDDADVAAGNMNLQQTSSAAQHQISIEGAILPVPTGLESSPPSFSTINTRHDLEFFDDLVSEPVLVLGVDITHLPRQTQFVVCAIGVFSFSLLYGYLQELIAVQICNRQLALFQAMMQFVGYTMLAHVLNQWVYRKLQKTKSRRRGRRRLNSNDVPPISGNSQYSMIMSRSSSMSSLHVPDNVIQLPSADSTVSLDTTAHSNNNDGAVISKSNVPVLLYVGLSLLRALDLAMTNLAMQYINYPAKTLMKSSRVVFTMLFGVLISRKRYNLVDYAIVGCMVTGLGLFLHADAASSAVFHGTGVVMLTVSLVCDGAISNVSETIMSQHGVGQDEVSSFIVLSKLCKGNHSDFMVV